MRSAWMFLGGISVFWLISVEATYRYDMRCQCYGRSNYCVLDRQGFRCLNCRGNTEGRQCERCKDGFYHRRAGESCLPCGCSPTGSDGAGCDSQGHCKCKPGLQGDKCDRCPDGSPLTQAGCPQSDSQLTEGQQECFCYGHATDCIMARGYVINDITSSFSESDEGWTAAENNGVTPPQLHFRWSPSHGDLEVISKESMPVYLYAPAKFLGNQVLSYGQTLSFSLRLDRGTRRPSKSDVVLEGAGLRVTAALGDLRTILLSGQKTPYTFRLDERPGSKWQPQLSSLQFQKLLQNLTAIKIRGTFGENGRGYLDNVRLVSAKVGSGTPAEWVGKCSCPAGYEGQFCERCAAGYTRLAPAQGPFSPCQPCSCRGGSCDPETGDCYSGDETPVSKSCPSGYYLDSYRICRTCPCPQGVSCSVTPGSLEVKCDACAAGVTGSKCNKCEEGFYGDPLGEYGPQRACQRCRCGGHLDPNAVGTCDRVTGECLKCTDHTTGFFCERCEDGFYRTEPSQACQPCSCDAQGSLSKKCSSDGQCLCREGFEGKRCVRSACPACFDQVKNQMEGYQLRLREMEDLFAGMESGTLPVTDDQMKKTLRKAERLVSDLQESADTLSDAEINLQSRVMEINVKLTGEEKDLQSVSNAVESIKEHDQRYNKQLFNIRRLITDIRSKLSTAKRELSLAEFPLGDSDGESHSLSSLAERAIALADKHQGEAVRVEGTAQNALSEAEKALVLMRSAISGENKVTEMIGELKNKYDRSSARVKAMENQATRVGSSALEESRIAGDALRQIASLEKNLPGPLTGEISGVTAALDALRNNVEKNLTQLQQLQTDFQEDRGEVEDLLARGKEAKLNQDQLLARVNAAKGSVAESLEDINANVDGLDQVLDTLRGFDEQIGTNKAKADEAIKRLPAIQAIIQDAVGSNLKTQGILDSVDGDYNHALETVSKLGDAVALMEGAPKTLTVAKTLLRDATIFNNDLKTLSAQASDTMGRLTNEVEAAEKEDELAKEALAGAAGAHFNAKNTRDAVGDTMQAVTNLLSLIGQPGKVDEERLTELEGSMALIRDKVSGELRPRLRAIQDQEARQKTLITRMDADIDRILLDIDNLEKIRATIPQGCFNLLPVERP